MTFSLADPFSVITLPFNCFRTASQFEKASFQSSFYPNPLSSRCSLQPRGPASVLPGPSRTSETCGPLLVCLGEQNHLQQTQLQPHILAWDGDGRRKYPVTVHLSPLGGRDARGLSATEPVAD